MKKRGKHSNKNTDISKKRKKEDEKWVPKAFLKNDCKTNNTTDNTLYDSDDYENDSIDNTLDTQEFKQKKINKKKKHIILKLFIFVILPLIIIFSLILGFKIHTFLTLSKEMIKNESSIVVTDDGTTKIAEIGCERIRENVTLDKIPNNLKNSYVAIEDQRYYKHHGIDILRTSSAIFHYIIKRGSADFGGSSITQQLVKNLTGDNSNSASRKIKEWIYALSLEKNMSKDKILESYLNIIYVGPNIYGVQSGAKYYFNKDVTDLSLAECAFLAGINNSPNSYNPFSDTDHSEKIIKRTKVVLKKMLELKYINYNDYNNAISETEQGLKFSKGITSNSKNINSYHTDALTSKIIDDFSKKNLIPKNFAENYFALSKAKIYSTQNIDIQSKVEEEFAKKKYILYSSRDKSITSEAAMVIIDQSNGKVLACVGGLGEKKTSRGFNRATQSKRQTGSAIKPIAVLAPALEKKLITNASMFSDVKTTFNDGSKEGYSPTNYDGYLGNITVRKAVESSQNIPFVKIMEKLTPKTSIKYLKQMGISTLKPEDENLALALGGLDDGMTPLEFAAAYATIANDGIYVEPIFYTKVISNNNETLLQCHQKRRRVFSTSTAYLLKELLRQPVIGNNGTATYCNITNIDVAAKTGTTNDNYDRWLCGFTPYYTAVTWYGFDKNESINYDGKNPAGLIWSSVMKSIHSKLSKRTFVAPNNIVSSKICSKSRNGSYK